MNDKTRIRRLPERAVVDREAIAAILDEGFVCHVGYVVDGRPVVIPTLYVRDGDRVLLHGSNSMGIARAVRSGSPLSVAVTLVDGLVLARSSFNSSANYRSVVIHGTGLILDGVAKTEAFDAIVERLIPGRLADLRPSTPAEMAQTTVISLVLDEVSAKVRDGGPEDEKEDLAEPVWAGVLPTRLVFGEPEPDLELAEGIEVPDYLLHYRR